jgi:alcohol dehydrogenase
VLSILDPRLVLTAPNSVAASAGMDAFTHALESFVSKKATYLSRIFSIEAFRLLMPNLKKMPEAAGDTEVAGKIQLGAFLAGTALVNSSAGPAGGLSYLLGTWYKVPHGVAGAVFLPHIHKFNLERGYKDYSLIYDAVYGPGARPDLQKAAFIINEIFFLNRKLGVREKLSSYGIDKNGAARILTEAFSALKGAFDNNPVPIQKEDLESILGQIL